MDAQEIRKEILRDEILSRLSALAKEKRIPLFLVGGYIRDLMLGRVRKDYDLTLPREASPSVPLIEKALHFRFFRVGKVEKETLTYRLVKKDISIDLTFIQEGNIGNDLQRRDFTVNAIAFCLQDETFHAVPGAIEDIEKRVIRTASNRSLDQDPLRMLRAVRYLCTLDAFTLDPQLREEMALKSLQIQKLPGERIKMELDRILLSPRPALGVDLLYQTNVFLALFPEFKTLENLGQNAHHHLDVLPHILLMVEKIRWAIEWIALKGREIFLTPEDRLSLYYAALFHDLGKQDTFTKDENGRVHFYHHESFSCQRADAIMERLHFSNLMKHAVLKIIQNHMRILNLSRETREAALKRLVNQIGDETPLLVLHTLADKEASRGILSIQIDEVVEDHCLRTLELSKEREIVHPLPLITGHDVMVLGYPPGPKVGEILNFMRQKQVEGEIKNREEALEVLRQRFTPEGKEDGNRV